MTSLATKSIISLQSNTHLTMNFAASASDLSLSAIYEKRRGKASVALGNPQPALSFDHPPAAQALPNLEFLPQSFSTRPTPPTLRPATAPLRFAPSASSLQVDTPPRELPATLDFGFAPMAAESAITTVAPVAEPAVTKAPTFSLPVDPFRIIDIIWRRTPIALLAGFILGVPLYTLARFRVAPHYVASAQIIRTDPPSTFRASATGEPFKPTAITVPVLVNMMRASALLDRVSGATKPTVPLSNIVAGLVITPERNSDLVRVAWTSTESPEQAVATLNTYTTELANYTKELQARDAADINTYLKREIGRVEKDHLAVNEELLRYARESLSTRIKRLTRVSANWLTTI
jgi:capsular polysaccharide biosynthesis protein